MEKSKGCGTGTGDC